MTKKKLVHLFSIFDVDENFFVFLRSFSGKNIEIGKIRAQIQT